MPYAAAAVVTAMAVVIATITTVQSSHFVHCFDTKRQERERESERKRNTEASGLQLY